MNELLLNAQRARFGSSSEKQDYVMPNQVGIFNEAEAEQDPKAPEPTEETILVPAHNWEKAGIQTSGGHSASVQSFGVLCGDLCL